MMEFLLTRTAAMTILGLFVWGILTLTRCRDGRLCRIGWEIVLLAGIVGAAFPWSVTIPLHESISEPTPTLTAAGSMETLPERPADFMRPLPPPPMIGADLRTRHDFPAAASNAAAPVPTVTPDPPIPAEAPAVSPWETPAAYFTGALDFLRRHQTAFGWTYALVLLFILAADAFGSVFVGLRAMRGGAWPDDALSLWNETLAEAGISPETAGRIRPVLTKRIGPSVMRLTPRTTALFIPRSFWERASDEVRRGVLRHELAHFQGGDTLRIGLFRIIAILHWFNPAAHLAIRRLEETLEWRADALAFGGRRDGLLRFAESMIALQETAPRRRLLQSRFGQTDFLRRLEQLKARHRAGQEKWTMKKTLTLIAITLAFGLCLTRVTLTGADDAAAQNVPAANHSDAADENNTPANPSDETGNTDPGRITPKNMEDEGPQTFLYHRVGIGVTLGWTDGLTEVKEILDGSPAQRQGGLAVGDRILAVGQGENGPMEEIADLKDAIEKICRKDGTVLRLKVSPGDRILRIVRSEFDYFGKPVKGEIFDVGVGGNESLSGPACHVGVITLSNFYLGQAALRNGDRGVRSSAGDVKSRLEELSARGMDVCVLDLRGAKSGGLLSEAVNLTGLFIGTGNVVRIPAQRSVHLGGGSVMRLDDEDPSVTWSGPLIVLTVGQSAGGAEIVAGAVRDYHRGLIVGEKTTRGRGTIQTLRRTGGVPGSAADSDANVVTIGGCWLPSGRSPQPDGIPSDIILPFTAPSENDVAESASRKLPSIDPIAPVDDLLTFQNVTPEIVATLAERSSKRTRGHAEVKTDRDPCLEEVLNIAADYLRLLREKNVTFAPDAEPITLTLTEPSANPSDKTGNADPEKITPSAEDSSENTASEKSNAPARNNTPPALPTQNAAPTDNAAPSETPSVPFADRAGNTEAAGQRYESRLVPGDGNYPAAITVRVVDRQGNPIPHAKGIVASRPDPFLTDEDGVWVSPPLSKEDWRGWVGEFWPYFQVSADGFFDFTFILEEPSPPKEIFIVMEPAKRIGGIVTGPTEKTLDGASVEIRDTRPKKAEKTPGDNAIPTTNLAKTVMTDADGKWFADLSVETESVLLTMTHPRYPEKTVRLNSSEADLDSEGNPIFQTTLYPGFTLTGRVVSPDGKPVADAVVIRPLRSRLNNDNAPDFNQRTKTDSDGVFHLENVAPSDGNILRADAPGFGPVIRNDVTFAPDAEPITLTLTEPSANPSDETGNADPEKITPPALPTENAAPTENNAPAAARGESVTFEGTVHDAYSKAPIPGAEISLATVGEWGTWNETVSWQKCRTDSNAEFKMTLTLPAIDYDHYVLLTVRAQDYEIETHYLPTKEFQKTFIERKERWELHLSKQNTLLEGRAVTETGEPLAGLMVAVTPDKEFLLSSLDSTPDITSLDNNYMRPKTRNREILLDPETAADVPLYEGFRYVRTDSDGVFRIKMAGLVRCCLLSDEFVPTELSFQEIADRNRKTLSFSGSPLDSSKTVRLNTGDIVMKKGNKPTITLLDQNDRPVPNAVVSMEPRERFYPFGVLTTRKAETDPNGVATLPAVHVGDPSSEFDNDILSGKDGKYRIYVTQDAKRRESSETVFNEYLVQVDKDHSNWTLRGMKPITVTLRFDRPITWKWGFTDALQFLSKQNRDGIESEFSHFYLRQAAVEPSGDTLRMVGVPAFPDGVGSLSLTKTFPDSKITIRNTADGRTASSEPLNPAAPLPGSQEDAVYDVSITPWPELTVDVIDTEGRPIPEFNILAMLAKNRQSYLEEKKIQEEGEWIVWGSESWESKVLFSYHDKENTQFRVLDADWVTDPSQPGSAVLKRLTPNAETIISVETSDGRHGQTTLTLADEEKRRIKITAE